jgi:hypothetical protein
MIYLHIVLPTYLPTYQPTLHIRTIYLPCQRILPHNLLHYRSSYTTTLLIVTLQQRYRHNGILVISTTEHREADLQTKIAII